MSPPEMPKTSRRPFSKRERGKLGNYDRACWQVTGRGEFRPLEGSSPALGSIGELHEVEEIRVEILLEEERAGDVIAALKEVHPYEEPAWDLVRIIRW